MIYGNERESKMEMDQAYTYQISENNLSEQLLSLKYEQDNRIEYFNLNALVKGVFFRLCPLFSIDCCSLTLYSDTNNHIQKTFNAFLEHGEIVCSEVNGDKIILTSIQREIASFDYPMLKSGQDWEEEFGENHLLPEHDTIYLFHGYIPVEQEGRLIGTFEIHNQRTELSAEALNFCCNIADFISGLLWGAKTQETKQNAHSDLNTINQSTQNNFIHLIENLPLNSTRTEIAKTIESYFLKNYNADYAELLINPDEMLFENAGLQAGRVNLFSIREINSLFAKQEYLDLWNANDIRTLCVLPLEIDGEISGKLLIGFNNENKVGLTDFGQINIATNLILLRLDNLLKNEKYIRQQKEINEYKLRLAEVTLYEAKAEGDHAIAGIIGSSAEMRAVYRFINRIAPSETTVLILGETGTGKELIAKAIHDGSLRGKKTMVKVNCAAIPPELIESELFGHEKGSFTGATEKRIGKFELAHRGTIFLDEIGELSLDLQVKLLRVLQEKEIERIGGKTTIATDVRIISATNRNLSEEVAAGRFRQDLFYRLNVIPLTLPPLRTRRDDIPLLAVYFLEKFAKKSGRVIDGFSKKAMASLINYSWPGNVRQLEHLIERHIVMANGKLIKDVEIPEIQQQGNEASSLSVKTIFENERDHIFKVLKLCNGKISGKNGAAKLLGVPATTLNSKIKKLGLARKHIF